MQSAERDSMRVTITVAQAAAIIGVSVNTMHEALRRGDFPSIRIGRRVLVPRAAFERMVIGEQRPA